MIYVHHVYMTLIFNIFDKIILRKDQKNYLKLIIQNIQTNIIILSYF
jgi:hypothetical protein